MTASIYALLHKIVSNEDGVIYKSDDKGMEKFNSISKMPPE